MDDDLYASIFNYLTDQTYPVSCTNKDLKRRHRMVCKPFIINGGVLFHKKDNTQVVLATQKEGILKAFHSDPNSGGHQGINRTHLKVRAKYWWKGLSADVATYVEQCPACSMVNSKSLTGSVPLHPIEVPSKVWSLCGIDLVGPLPTTPQGNKYIVAMTCLLSKWVEAAPLPDKTAAGVADFIFKTVCQLGCMDAAITDQGTELVNEVNTLLCEKLSIDHRICSPYHPQTNGRVFLLQITSIYDAVLGQRERDNRTMKDALKKLVDESGTNWDEKLPGILFAIRTSVQTSTKLTPFEIMYGRKPRMPIDLDMSKSVKVSAAESDLADAAAVAEGMNAVRQSLIDTASRNIKAAKVKQKGYFDRRKGAFASIAVGLLVQLRNPKRIQRMGSKMEPRWKGLYRVSAELDKGRVQLTNYCTNVVNKRLQHVSNLKVYKGDPEMHPSVIRHRGEQFSSAAYECAACKKVFMKKPALQQHVKVHQKATRTTNSVMATKPKPDLLDKPCKRSANGLESIKKQHALHKDRHKRSRKPGVQRQNIAKGVESAYICAICRMQCTSVSRMEAHLIMHSLGLIGEIVGTETEWWIEDLQLTMADKHILLSPSGWLTDRHVSAALKLLKLKHPQFGGLEDPVLIADKTAAVPQGEYVQIFHRGLHWFTASTVGCRRPGSHIRIYDSLQPVLLSSANIAEVVLYHRSHERDLKLSSMRTTKQPNGSDCGVFAVAFSTSICHGHDPSRIHYDVKAMRSHLAASFEAKQIHPFPRLAELRRGNTFLSCQYFAVVCSCRGLKLDGGETFSCISCKEEFHRACGFGKNGEQFLCANCF